MRNNSIVFGVAIVVSHYEGLDFNFYCVIILAMSLSFELGEGTGRKLGCLPLIGSLLLGVAVDYAAGQIGDHTYGVVRAEQFAEDAGYKDPQLVRVEHLATGFRGCDIDSSAAYVLDVTGLNGRRTVIDVCRTFFEGASIRQG
jgi:hypothetical protein